MGRKASGQTKTRCNVYLSQDELATVLSALDAMLDVLPLPDNVPDVDRADADRDRASYVLVREKLGKYQN